MVKPLPELLPGDRPGVCELRLGGVCLKGRLGTPKIKREVPHTNCKPEEVELLYHNVLETGETKEKLSRLLSCWVVS